MAESPLEEARKSLARMQDYNAATLPRPEKFGELNFQEAVEPAQRLINLFRQFPAQYLQELPPNQLNQIKSQADAAYSMLEQIERFDQKTGDAYGTRNSLISSLKNQYEQSFAGMSNLIAYGASRLRDFSTLESEARAAMQAAKDRGDEAAKQLEAYQQDAKRILDEIRQVAAEHGVSQQAVYFKDESEAHDTKAGTWRGVTIKLAIGLAAYAALSVFIHKWTFLAPQNTYEAIQLGLSKILIFGVIAYMLLLAARNFLSHTHNAIVNKHRQNALLTFTALSDAASSPEQRDAVINHAAACIFSPQDTGYSKGGGNTDQPVNVVSALPRIIAGSASTGGGS